MVSNIDCKQELCLLEDHRSQKLAAPKWSVEICLEPDLHETVFTCDISKKTKKEASFMGGKKSTQSAQSFFL